MVYIRAKWPVARGEGREMTKAEARMTKEGRMTKVEGKGGSDFGLRVSFVIRASSFGIFLSGFFRHSSFGIRHYNANQCNREVFESNNDVFLEKNGDPKNYDLRQTAKTSGKRASGRREVIVKSEKRLKNRDFLISASPRMGCGGSKNDAKLVC
jgi:hypothetical protein